jgi:hypothetical protein
MGGKLRPAGYERHFEALSIEDVLLLVLSRKRTDLPKHLPEIADLVGQDREDVMMALWKCYIADLVLFTNRPGEKGTALLPATDLWIDLTNIGVVRAAWVRAWLALP